MKNKKPALILNSLKRDFAALRQAALREEKRLQELRTARLLKGLPVIYKLEA